jgi:hypothetical protein
MVEPKEIDFPCDSSSRTCSPGSPFVGVLVETTKKFVGTCPSSKIVLKASN